MKFITSFSLLAVLFLSLYCCSNESHSRGKSLAEQYCANCHQLPNPGDLPKNIWASKILPKMGAYYGIYHVESRSSILGNARAAKYTDHLYPVLRKIDSTDWADLVNYYVSLAPDKLAGSEAGQPLDSLSQFRQREVMGNSTNPTAPYTTMIHFDSASEKIYTGGPGRSRGELQIFDANHVYQKSLRALSPPTAINPEREVILEIGSLLPSDLPRGSVSTLDGSLENAIQLDTLARPVDFIFIDLDRNGKEEMVVAEYGNMVGALKSYEKDTLGKWKLSKTLLDQPGAIRLRKADLDKDGFEDLLVLFGQGNESVYVVYSRPTIPELEQLIQFPPSYGSSDLEVIDFDGDGHLDLFTTNGDNFDYQPIPKPYHGIRYHRNQGDNTFKEEWFYPFDGAYNVEIADFDLDGDYDLATIAYFVPPYRRNIKSFIYLEQTDKSTANNLVFRASTFVKPEGHHYLCMTSGDVDGDGDIDILLGNFAAYLPDGIGKSAQKVDDPMYIFLENLSR